MGAGVNLGRILAVTLLMLSLGACSSVKHKPYKPADRQQVQRIGLLTPAVPDRLAVRMVIHPGQSLGLVGMLLAEGDMGGKTGDFTRAMHEQGMYCRRDFIRQIEQGLAQGGYLVEPISVARPHNEYAFLDRYPTSNGRVDAYLDLYTDLVGYTAAGGGTPYRPTVYLYVRLVSARDHQVLYQDRIAYNAFGNGDGAITLTPAAGYEFAAFDQLMAQPQKALQGLQLAMRATSDELVRQLR